MSHWWRLGVPTMSAIRQFRGSRGSTSPLVPTLKMLMANLDKCLEGLRALARSDDRTKLIEAELLIHDFVAPVASSPFTIRTSLANLDDAIIQEAEQNPQDAEFWQGVRAIIASRLSGDD